MSTYAIGDVQGCFAELEALLAKVNFNPNNDTLWFTGDLVNRGPQSLEVLRFIKALGDKHITVLGNHDLHLLAVAYGCAPSKAGDTMGPLLAAQDKQELLDWLRHRPLLHYDAATHFVLTHAGLAPAWTLSQAKNLAHEVEAILSSKTPEQFLHHLYGNQPNLWDEQLSGEARWRCIINYFTRMRFCYADGSLDLSYKGEIAGKPPELIPWFQLPNHLEAHVKIIFGHWAALGGKTLAPNLYALDTGCVWGNCLTAMRIEDEVRFNVKCG